MNIVVFREVMQYTSLDSIIGDMLPLFLVYKKMQQVPPQCRYLPTNLHGFT
jgi:hypothetical protein